MKSLTKAEERIMQALWELESAFTKEIIAQLEPPIPKYSTVATVLKVLKEKGFVEHKAYGNSHQFSPLVSKEAYKERSLGKMVKEYFSGSPLELMSFFLKKEQLTLEQLEEALEQIKKDKS